MKLPASPLRCGDGSRRRRSADPALSCSFLSLSTPFILSRTRNRCQRRRGNNHCSAEKKAKRTPRTWTLTSWAMVPRSASVCLQTAHYWRKIEPVICLRLCFWGLCSSQPNIIPSPQTRQHFISIINLEIVCQIFAGTRVSRSKCPLKEPGHPLGAWKSFCITECFVLGVSVFAVKRADLHAQHTISMKQPNWFY